jgi:hypothetical protein
VPPNLSQYYISNFSEEKIHQGGGISNGNLRLTMTLQQFEIRSTFRKADITMATLFVLRIKFEKDEKRVLAPSHISYAYVYRPAL